jgi:hypothetical protein
MVCNFAKECALYQSKAVTCNKDNGGPFNRSGKAYCGKYNTLMREQLVKLNHDVPDVIQAIDESNIEWVAPWKKVCARN